MLAGKTIDFDRLALNLVDKKNLDFQCKRNAAPFKKDKAFQTVCVCCVDLWHTMESHLDNHLVAPYPWLEPFGFRVGDRVSTLETDGHWTFKKANGMVATDTSDACVGTGADLAWTDEATAENQKVMAIQRKSQRENEELRRENRSLQRKIDMLLQEREKQNVKLQEDKEKMKVGCHIRCMCLRFLNVFVIIWRLLHTLP